MADRTRTALCTAETPNVRLELTVQFCKVRVALSCASVPSPTSAPISFCSNVQESKVARAFLRASTPEFWKLKNLQFLATTCVFTPTASKPCLLPPWTSQPDMSTLAPASRYIAL